MIRNDLFGFSFATFGVIAAAGMSPALGQTAIPTNIPGISAISAPPATVDPMTASAGELAKYALPPRPDAQTAPEAFAAWQRMMNPRLKRVVSTHLEQTAVYHGPMQPAPGAPPAGVAPAAGITYATSKNWSGTALVGKKKTTFHSHTVYGEFLVPVAQQPFNSCNPSWNYGAAFVGIDGYGSSDVFQAGIEFDASCTNNVTDTLYAAWMEWYPNAAIRIPEFPIKPGDLVTVKVWNTSPTAGNVAIVDYTTQQMTEFQINAPAGTALIGTSIEWILERPTVDGTLAQLTNYVAQPMTQDFAWDQNVQGGPTRSPGTKSTAAIANTEITMLDDNGQPISYGIEQGLVDLWFWNEGSAYAAP